MGNIISLISDISLTLTFVSAFIFGITEIRSSERGRREHFAFDYLSNFQSREFAELLNYITNKDIPTTVTDLKSLPENEQIIFVQLSQQMESLGLLVAGKRISIELIDRTLGSYVSLSWKKYEPLFTIIRKFDPYQGEYFQWLAEQLEKSKEENPRKPYYMLGTVAV